MDISSLDYLQRDGATEIVISMSKVFRKACKTGETLELAKIIEADLFDVNFTKIKDETETLSCLMYAIIYGPPGVVDLLLSEGANPNEISTCNDKRPLILAVQHGKLEKVLILLKYGADIALKERNGKSSALHYALHYAFDDGDHGEHYSWEFLFQLMRIILEHGSRLVVGNSKSLIRQRVFCKIYMAVIDDDPDRLRKLLKTTSLAELCRVESTYTPLRYAIETKSLDLIKVFIEFDPQEVLFSCITPDTVHMKVLEYLFSNQLIDINMRDKKGRTGLILARNDPELLVFFLEYDGADPHVSSECNNYPEYTLNDADHPDNHITKYFKKLMLIDTDYVDFQSTVIIHRIRDCSVRMVWFETHEPAYADELETLKNTRISESTSTNPAITLYDYLFLEPKRAVKFSRNENLTKLYQENDQDFRTTYPHYGFAINYQFRRSRFRKNLIETAGEILFSSFGSKELIDTREDIFQYFNINNLVKFTAVNLE